MSAADLVGNVSLFAGLAPADVAGILSISRRLAFAPGAALMRQGQPADGVFIVETGTADVLTALPGGGETAVANVGPGSVLGEMALLEAGVRSATVVARTPMTGHWIERDGFRMLLAQRNAAVFTVQGRITLALCRRLRELNAKIVAREAASDDAWDRMPRTPQEVRRGACRFDYRAFLPILPVFCGMDSDEIAMLAAHAEVVDAPRGALLAEQGTPSTACCAVIRGAVEFSTAQNGGRYRVGILGPGRLCGHMGLIDGVAHRATIVAREEATLLEFAKAEFERLYNGCERVNAKFRDAISRNLLEALAHTNNHLTRLVSQARIRRQGLPAAGEIDELERLLVTQDCEHC